MRETSWFNLRAGKARLAEIEGQIGMLEKEREVLRSLLGGEAAAPKPAGRRGRRKGPRTGPSLVALIAEAIKAGPKDKGWTAGDLVEALGKKHPGRLAGSNPSSLVSATLAQGLRAKNPLFVARKARGKRAKLYRLA